VSAVEDVHAHRLDACARANAPSARAPHRELNLEFEIPFRELGFFGVPHRATSFVLPTVNCLVELTELPFTVLTLNGAAACLGMPPHASSHRAMLVIAW
jgi:nucleosome binding factor SPN SPT16 subunit